MHLESNYLVRVNGHDSKAIFFLNSTGMSTIP